MKAHLTAGWVAASAFAIWVGTTSYIIANEVRAPAAGRAAGFAPRGTANANFAMMTYGIRTLKDPHTAVSKAELDLARAAYRAEPLSSTALSLIVTAMPQGKTRQSLLTHVGELTRRNSLLNEEQIRAAALRGDDQAFFRWLSRSVLTNNDLRAAYVGAMADATAREDAVAALTPVIGSAPSWSDIYWREVVQRPASLLNAAKLRTAVAKPPWRQTTVSRWDRALSIALANHGHFDAARALYEGLGRARERRSGYLLSDGGFGRQPELPPFDWQLAVSGTLGASIDDRDKTLLVSAISGARGFAARQLVFLPPGNYRLGWSLSVSMPITPSPLRARVSCAERGVKAAPIQPISLTAGQHAKSFIIPESVCRWYWLSIDVVLPDDSVDIDAYFRSISLTRTARREESPHAVAGGVTTGVYPN